MCLPTRNWPEVEKLLIEQNKLLMTRYQDLGTLNNLMRSGSVWAAPEFSQVYRQLQELNRKGEANVNIQHRLQAKEGGLGWIDSWMITSGVEDQEKLDLCHAFMNTIVEPEHDEEDRRQGRRPSTCIDIRPLSTEEERELFLMDRTDRAQGPAHVRPALVAREVGTRLVQHGSRVERATSLWPRR